MAQLIAPASRSRKRIAQVVETNRGETPSSASYKIIPHLDSTALNQTQTFERSGEVKSNRQGGKQVGGTIQSGGPIAVPMKNDPAIRELLESAMSAAFTNVVASGAGGNPDGFAFTTTTITRTTGSFINDGWQVGDQILVSGATTPGNNIVAADLIKVTAVAALILTLSGGLTTAEAFAAGTTATSRSYYLKAGTTRKFFTHEVTYLDLSPVVFEYFRGMEVNTLSITIPTSGEVTGEFGMIGLIGLITNTEFDRSNNLSGTTTTGTGTRAAAAGTVAFAGSVAGSALDRGGSLAPEVESLTININNNRGAKFAVGQNTAAFVEEGDFDVEFTFALYFRDKGVQEDYLNGTRTSLKVTVKDQQDGHAMVMEFPTVVFTQGPKGLSGQAYVQNMTAFAEESATHLTKMRLWVQPALSST